MHLVGLFLWTLNNGIGHISSFFHLARAFFRLDTYILPSYLFCPFSFALCMGPVIFLFMREHVFVFFSLGLLLNIVPFISRIASFHFALFPAMEN